MTHNDDTTPDNVSCSSACLRYLVIPLAATNLTLNIVEASLAFDGVSARGRCSGLANDRRLEFGSKRRAAALGPFQHGPWLAYLRLGSRWLYAAPAVGKHSILETDDGLANVTRMSLLPDPGQSNAQSLGNPLWISLLTLLGVCSPSTP